MAQPAAPAILDVTAQNVDRTGFFCFMSKKKAEGYRRKLAWLKDRFAEGMRLKMLELPERGFIEYLPGESAWRAVHADGYLFIHCLWVVGKSKGKGLGAALLDLCLADAKRSKMKGVAMVTSEKVWLAGRGLLDRHGFECVDTAPPAFSLMVKKFGKHPSPAFAGGWDEKARACGKGLTVIRSDQCPYIEDASATAVAAAAKAGVASQVVELRSREDVLRLSPSAYGVFGLVRDGRLLSYHYQLEKDLLPLLSSQTGGRAGRG
jgi:ribosomal protein S18 acetylase RimI-like enzyme